MGRTGEGRTAAPWTLCGYVVRMSNLDLHPAPSLCGGRADTPGGPVRELLEPKRVPLGESTYVRRLLPNLGRRMVGGWAFVDHYSKAH
ncbi:hypothetical protein GCM10010214_20680 [Streptomyces abikoensis]|nr:hypothetical protein GCM10010214_20680 [Streptomyces abikoensis]